METSDQLFYQAATLMLVGMGFVYAFLTLLILVIKLFISPLAKRFPDPVIAETQHPPLKSGTDQPSTAVVAAISAAVTQYRKKN